MDMDEFQALGEPYRQMFGIDGTAGDAQDVQHPFVPASPGGSCVVCGLAESYKKHAGALWPATPRSSRTRGRG